MAFLMLSYTVMVMFYLVEALLMLSYTGMVYVLSFGGFLDVILVITGMVYTVIVHRDGVCSLL